MQIIHAVKTWFWIEACSKRRAEPFRDFIPVKPVDLGVFIAYFPTWLKYHELYRLGAYGHPYDFISTNYANDLDVSKEYQVRGTGWEEMFEAFGRYVQEPFAFLTPAMQDGSALGGPFLPTDGLSLTEIHEMMHLGSIWSIGPPIMPAILTEIDGKKACYSHLAFPDHWYEEVYYNDDIHRLFSPGHDLCDMSKVIEPFKEDDIEYLKENSQFHVDVRQGIVHVGARMGSPINPGWTTQLPAKNNVMICVDHEPHWCALSTGLSTLPVRLNYEASQAITDTPLFLRIKQGVIDREMRKTKANNTQIAVALEAEKEAMRKNHQEEIQELQNKLEGKERFVAHLTDYIAELRNTSSLQAGEGRGYRSFGY
ncbi:hypothetical protein NW752_009813 [Fusarium irregulare]|uniref:Uncharacterized protein n=1 Tax=Fusarium irregulare TaxID=2494466 RepID=A0A9W8PXQ8_9HYPO|nr:hypothetical protein NW752_009813 [Fusarium irregulare]KAJ4020981.1 hypothetical protein NW766_002477 [Fusarium irregulare]